MLLRGGLDGLSGSARAGGATLAADEADWQSFCSRIGWQDDDHRVGDDYTDRLAEKVFGGAALREHLIELAIEREVKAVKDVPVTPSALRRATARGALLAVAGMAAAAVVCFFGASVLSGAGSTARAVPVQDAPAPAVAPLPMALPLESATAEPTAAPVDSASPKTKPPGSLVAQRSSRHRARGRIVAKVGAPAEDHRVEVAQAVLALPAAQPAFEAKGALAEIEGITPPSFEHTVAVLDHGVGASSSTWTAPSRVVAGASRARGTPPQWGLSSASDRWYGVGLAPMYEASSLPAGMAVMAQVDVGKAFKL